MASCLGFYSFGLSVCRGPRGCHKAFSDSFSTVSPQSLIPLQKQLPCPYSQQELGAQSMDFYIGFSRQRQPQRTPTDSLASASATDISIISPGSYKSCIKSCLNFSSPAVRQIKVQPSLYRYVSLAPVLKRVCFPQPSPYHAAVKNQVALCSIFVPEFPLDKANFG